MMFNLAGRRDCDKFIEVELESTGFERKYLPAGCKYNGEVPWSVYSEFRGWKFIRAWSYWIASATKPDSYIPKKEAEAFNERWGKQVRFDGYAGGTNVSHNADCYHINTVEGLRQFWSFLNSWWLSNNSDAEAAAGNKEYYQQLLKSYKEKDLRRYEISIKPNTMP